MPEASAAPVAAVPPETQPAEKPDAKPAEVKVDPAAEKKAQANALLKELGLNKLKAKDREVEVDLEGLRSRASRVFGIESVLEEAKATKARADDVLSLQKVMAESESAEDAIAALEKLAGPRAKQIAALLTRRELEREESEKAMSESEKETRRQLDEHRKALAEYRKREEDVKRASEEAAHKSELQRARDEASKLAMSALKALGVESPETAQALTPAVLPRVARTMRVAIESGIQLSPEEAAQAVREEMTAEWQGLTAKMDDAALYAFLGDAPVKRLVREHLRRMKAGSAKPAQETQAPPKKDDGADKLRGLPGFFRR